MILIDVNVLVHAYREDSPLHIDIRRWLTDTIDSETPFGVAEIVLSGFLRITTHPKIFEPPSPLEDSLRFVEILRSNLAAMVIDTGGEWITTDRGFARFPGLRWRHPLG